MNITKKGLIALGAAVLLVLGVAAPAHAGGSDSPPPYTVDSAGITLPGGDTFPDGGHVNLTTSQGGKGIHFESLNNQPSGEWIGQSFIPWSAFGLTDCDTVSWVQISLYNEHFGEGGQPPVTVGNCAPPEDDPPVEEPPVDTPVYELTTSHVAECGTVSISLRNVSPWLYRVLIEMETAPGVWERVTASTGDPQWQAAPGVMIVDNRGDAPDDQTGVYVVTFPEDSGTHNVRYKVTSGAEQDLYMGLPVGEFTTVTVESDCETNIPPVVPPVNPPAETLAYTGIDDPMPFGLTGLALLVAGGAAIGVRKFAHHL